MVHRMFTTNKPHKSQTMKQNIAATFFFCSVNNTKALPGGEVHIVNFCKKANLKPHSLCLESSHGCTTKIKHQQQQQQFKSNNTVPSLTIHLVSVSVHGTLAQHKHMGWVSPMLMESWS